MNREEAIRRQDVLDLAKKGVLISNGSYKSVCKAINELPPVTPQPSISQPDIEAIRQEIETEMNLCRMKDTVSKGYKGKILEEVLGKIDKYIQKPQEKWIDEDDNRYICKECEYAHKPQKEPCEDAISRQAVLDLIADYDLSMGQVVKGIHALPPVNPTKTGHWIEHPEIETSTPEYLMFYECSECGDRQCFCKSDIHKKRFCSNCGCRMVEPQERSRNE